MKKNTTILSLVVFFVLIGGIHAVSSLPKLYEECLKLAVSPLFLLVPFPLFFLQESLNPLQALLALKSIGQRSQYCKMLQITLLSTSANSTAPFPAGMPLRAYLQKKILGIPYGVSSIGMAIETGVGYGVSASAALLLSVIYLPTYLAAMLQHIPINKILLSLLLICFIVFLLFFWKREKIYNFIVTTRQSLESVLSRYIIFMTMVSLLVISLAGLRVMMILQVYDQSIDILLLLNVMLISHFAGVLSFLPMGLGVRDASLTSLLVLVGIPFPVAIASAALDRIVITIPYIVGGILVSRLLLRDVSDEQNFMEKKND